MSQSCYFICFKEYTINEWYRSIVVTIEQQWFFFVLLMCIKAYDDCEYDIMDINSMVLQSHLSEYGDGCQGW